MSFRTRIGQFSRRFSSASRHEPVVLSVEWTPGLRGPVAVPGLTGRVRGPPARRSRLQDRALGQTPAGRRRRGRPRRWCARCNPRRGGRRRCGLVVSDHQVQVAAVPREGAGEGDDLEGALPGAMLSAAGEPHSDLGQAANAGQHPACLDAFAGGEGQQLGFEVGAGTQPQGDRAHAAKGIALTGAEQGPPDAACGQSPSARPGASLRARL
jgi:hypothetical protein